MKIKKLIKFTLLSASTLVFASNISAIESNVSPETTNSQTYNIFPYVHKIEYLNNSYLITNNINIVIEDSVDFETLTRIKEISKKQNIEFTTTRRVQEGKTNILIGILDDKDELVDNYAKNNNINFSDELKNKNDSYIIHNNDNKIVILAKNQQASFYAVNTLYNVLNQLQDKSIQNFKIEDYSDLSIRGIFSNNKSLNWSKSNILDFLKWSSLYKLNTFFYANNNVKQNNQWKELYSDNEIIELQEYILEAQKNKIDFVYTIDPFNENAITNDTYAQDLELLKSKFLQLIKLGVKNFSLSNDKSLNNSEELQLLNKDKKNQLINDLNSWLKEQNTQISLFYVLNENELESLSGINPNIAQEIKLIVNLDSSTNVSNEKIVQLKSNIQNNLVFLVNWPDNFDSKDQLILGGYKELLPKNISNNAFDGLLLNPMSFANASRIAVFGALSYSWNLWNDDNTINNIWNNSFNYSWNGLFYNTPEVDALTNLAKHMISKKINVSHKLQESIELKPKLDELKKKLSNKSFTINDLNLIEEEFEQLNNYSNIVLRSTSNFNFKQEIQPWIESFKDLSSGVVLLMQALKEYKKNNNIEFAQLYNSAISEINNSKQHKFLYKNQEINPEIGVLHIQPFVEEVLDFATQISSELFDTSNKDYGTTITNLNSLISAKRDVTSLSNKDEEIYNQSHQRTQNLLKAGDWYGVSLNRPTLLKSIYIQMGSLSDHFIESKLEYKVYGSDEWHTITGQDSINKPRNDIQPIEVTNLNIENVTAVRIYNKTDQSERAWFRISNFVINHKEQNSSEKWINVTYDQTNTTMTNAGGDQKHLSDENPTTEFWLKNNSNSNDSNRDSIDIDKTFGFRLENKQEVTKILVEQGWTKESDILKSFIIEYKDDAGNWKQFGSKVLSGLKSQTVVGNAIAQEFRIVNKQHVPNWWRLGTIKVAGYNPVENPKFNIFANNVETDRGSLHYVLRKNNQRTVLLRDKQTTSGYFKKDTAIDIDFSKSMFIDSIKILQDDTNNKLNNIIIKGKKNKDDYEILDTVELNNLNSIISIAKDKSKYIGIRIENNSDVNNLWSLKQIEIKERHLPDERYLYANQNNTGLVTTHQGNEFSLFNKENSEQLKEFNLNKGESIGLDLKDIYTVSKISANFTKTQGISLLYSSNGYIWNTIEDFENLDHNINLRYLLFTNQSEESKTLPFKDLIVTTTNKIELGKLVDSNIGIVENKNDDRNSLKEFDGDFTTFAKFSATPKTNQFITYDLGKEIELNSLSILSNANTSDYPKDLDVYVSNQNSDDINNWTKVLTIGDDQIDTDADLNLSQTEKGQIYYNNPNIKYWSNNDLPTNLKARFIKLVIKADYPQDKSLIINEIILNQGRYISTNQDPRFEGQNYEEVSKDHTPEKLLDKDISTFYQPANTNGLLKYFITKEEYANKDVRFYTKGLNSQANVRVLMYDEKTSETKKVELGTLSYNLMDFRINYPNTDAKILGFEIEWKSIIPSIIEILPLDKAESQTETDTSKLQELVNTKPAKLSRFTAKAKNEYESLLETIQNVLKSPNVKQYTIDLLKNSLEEFLINPELRVDISQLKKILVERLNNSENWFTNESYAVYAKTILKIEESLKDFENMTNSDINALLDEHEKSLNQLQISNYNRQQTELNVKEFKKLNNYEYETQGFNDLQKYVLYMEEKLADSKTAPYQFWLLNSEYDELFKKLVKSPKGEILAQYKDFRDNSAYNFVDNNETKWADESQKIVEKINAQNTIINSPESSIEEIKQALDELKNITNQAQETKTQDLDKLKSLTVEKITNDSNIYTNDSFAEYNQKIDLLNEKLNNISNLNKQEIDQLIREVNSAKSSLVIPQDKVQSAKENAQGLLKNISNPDLYNQKLESAKNPSEVNQIINEINHEIALKKVADFNQNLDKIKQEIDKVQDEYLKQKLLNDLNNTANLEKLLELQKEVNNNQSKNKLFFDKKQELLEKLKLIKNVDVSDKVLQEINNATYISQLENLSNTIDKIITTQQNPNELPNEEPSESSNELNTKKDELKTRVNHIKDTSIKNDLVSKIDNANSIEEINSIQNEIETHITKQQETNSQKSDQINSKENKTSNIATILGSVFGVLGILGIFGLGLMFGKKKKQK
ncbi:beta-N-acetylglucosaminidase domain-containing protein [Mycoplasma leonicaptivi]|uniref:beta-N-acetylglucosaminidase domain-containing protein n=1 Tax=Mycoplasma leonicaptivi TaxID=36742 RepID=UPI000486D7D8|nr:beta-N-acetylglucosaminidase domain-containing protein [Mycoplasma leonicaptivi]